MSLKKVDKKDIIEYEKMRIQDLEKTLTHCTAEDQIKMNTYLLKKAQKSLQENTEKKNDQVHQRIGKVDDDTAEIYKIIILVVLVLCFFLSRSN